MVKLIVGGTGTGKSKHLVADLNEEAKTDEGSIICIIPGDRLNPYIKYHVRMIDTTEYPINTYDEFLAFIAGINARDFDVSLIYIDSIGKIVNVKILESHTYSLIGEEVNE